VFERRLKVLLGVLGLVMLVILVRLVELQLVHGSYYRQQAARNLLRDPVTLPFVRGSILDRKGERLVYDAPCWDIRVDYSLLALHKPRYLNKHVKEWRRRHRSQHAATNQEVEEAVFTEVEQMWHDLAAFAARVSPVTAEEFRARGKEIHDRVERVRQKVADRNGFEMDVAEERMAHTILEGLDQPTQVAAQEHLRRYLQMDVDPHSGRAWMHIEPAKARAFAPHAEPFAHILGRMGAVSADDLADDPNEDDPLARYLANDRRGILGVEYTAERTLRGRRGRILKDDEGNVVEDEPAVDGQDVALTISAGLQRRLYDLMADELRQIPLASGGVVVVLDVATREALALVSYPAYDPAEFNELYAALRDDTERLPLRFRAVANQYPPGSIMKPLVCLCGLNSGLITVETEQTCTGYLFEDIRDRWRCWRVHGTDTRKAHGQVNVIKALRESCNVFMYRLGEDLGIDALTSAFDMVGIGRRTGTGLPEEVKGINPTPGYLAERLNRPVTRAHARLFAVGQGELSLTPIQVANLVATYANGKWREAKLIRPEQEPPEWILPGRPEHWAAIRQGLYEVVNDPTGTAYETARFLHPRYVLCGKTGSATAHPWPTSYRIPYVDVDGVPGEVIVPAGSRSDAKERFAREFPSATFELADVEKASTWPPGPPSPEEGEHHAHAWFAGFLQAADGHHQPIWSEEPRVAFTVLVEFGGSGGRVSGPIAQKIASVILEIFGEDLDF
jgi:cell division protein FtsI/penicillin-binding protein 2